MEGVLVAEGFISNRGIKDYQLHYRLQRLSFRSGKVGGNEQASEHEDSLRG